MGTRLHFVLCIHACGYASCLVQLSRFSWSMQVFKMGEGGISIQDFVMEEGTDHSNVPASSHQSLDIPVSSVHPLLVELTKSIWSEMSCAVLCYVE